MIELNKSQRKIARMLINRALERECRAFLKELEQRFLQDEKMQSSHEKYLDVYKSVRTFDKYVRRQYDDLTGSCYALALLSLFCNGVLTEDDFSEFDDTTRAAFLEHKRLWPSDL